MTLETPLASFVLSSIVEMEVDAIVNSANCSLLGGGGVDGAIHKAGGYLFTQACGRLGGCDYWQVKHTDGFAMPCRYVLHAVARSFDEADDPERQLLELHRNVFRLAADLQVKTLALPAIAAGIFKFPLEIVVEAATTALTEAKLERPELQVTFCFIEETWMQRFWELSLEVCDA